MAMDQDLKHYLNDGAIIVRDMEYIERLETESQRLLTGVCAVEKYDGFERYEIGNRLGDSLSWTMFENFTEEPKEAFDEFEFETRKMPMWSPCFAVVALGDDEKEFFRLSPIRDVGIKFGDELDTFLGILGTEDMLATRYKPDLRVMPKDPVIPYDMVPLKGQVGIITAATEESGEPVDLLIGHNVPLVAAHFRGVPEPSMMPGPSVTSDIDGKRKDIFKFNGATLLHDIDFPDELSPVYNARLHTAWRVMRASVHATYMEKGVTPGFAAAGSILGGVPEPPDVDTTPGIGRDQNLVAWVIDRITDPLEVEGRKDSTGAFSGFVGGRFVDGYGLGAVVGKHPVFGSVERVRPSIGFVGVSIGGPFHIGEHGHTTDRVDRHYLGDDVDGNPQFSLHLHTESLFKKIVPGSATETFDGREYDGPLEFQTKLYVKPKPLFFVKRAHIRWDVDSRHKWIDKIVPGAWRLLSEDDEGVASTTVMPPPTPIPEPEPEPKINSAQFKDHNPVTDGPNDYIFTYHAKAFPEILAKAPPAIFTGPAIGDPSRDFSVEDLEEYRLRGPLVAKLIAFGAHNENGNPFLAEYTEEPNQETGSYASGISQGGWMLGPPLWNLAAAKRYTESRVVPGILTDAGVSKAHLTAVLNSKFGAGFNSTETGLMLDGWQWGLDSSLDLTFEWFVNGALTNTVTLPKSTGTLSVASPQFLWETITADSGPSAAPISATDTLFLRGAGNISSVASGGNTITFSDSGQTKEFFDPSTGNGFFGNFPTLSVAASGGTERLVSSLPADVNTITDAVVVGIAAGTAAAIDLDIFITGGTTGEIRNNHSANDTAATYNITNLRHFELDISGIISSAGLTAGDRFSTRILNNDAAIVVHLLGTRIKYTT